MMQYQGQFLRFSIIIFSLGTCRPQGAGIKPSSFQYVDDLAAFEPQYQFKAFLTQLLVKYALLLQED